MLPVKAAQKDPMAEPLPDALGSALNIWDYRIVCVTMGKGKDPWKALGRHSIGKYHYPYFIVE